MSGMLGNSIFSCISNNKNFELYGTVRGELNDYPYLEGYRKSIIENIDAYNIASIETCILKLKPSIVINCIGVIKQQKLSHYHLPTIKINAALPHEIAYICDKINSKLIHFSTDCVFSGSTGLYKEDDMPDAYDLYGKSKYLGEVSYGNHLTLRTSIIGHEIGSSVSLIDWFLNQHDEVNGFSQAIFSGLPTCVVAEILEKKIIKNNELKGLYHLSVNPIDKYSLLKLVAKFYKKNIKIKKNSDLVIDRSLNSEMLQKAIKFKVPSWDDLIESMYFDYLEKKDIYS